MTLLRTFVSRTLLGAAAAVLSFSTAFAQTAPSAPAHNQTTAAAPAQSKAADMEPKTLEGKATQEHWDPDQLLTATVHQAWVLSNKNEANFYEMIEQLADISAKNRGVSLPESAAAGRRMGEYIKRAASADTDQLLYAVVDKAVVMIAKPAVHTAASAKK
jgi:hypothetical protein